MTETIEPEQLLVTEDDVRLALALPALKKDYRQRAAIANRTQKRDPEWLAAQEELGEQIQGARKAHGLVLAYLAQEREKSHEQVKKYTASAA